MRTNHMDVRKRKWKNEDDGMSLSKIDLTSPLPRTLASREGSSLSTDRRKLSPSRLSP